MDARWPDRALTDPVLDGLSDGAFRVFANGLAYTVGQNTDGAIPRRALRLLHPDGPRDDCADELVAHGAWTLNADGWRVRLFADAQTSAADVDRLRAAARERQQRSRARRGKSKSSPRDTSAAEPRPEADGHSPSRVTRTADTGASASESPTPSVTVTRDMPADSVTRDAGVTVQERLGKATERRGEAPKASTPDDAETEWSEIPRCEVCGGPMHARLAAAEGWRTHPACDLGAVAP